MLSRITGAEFHPDFVPGERSTALRHLKCEILEQSVQPGQPFEGDGSLSILGCPGIRREVEVVANEIWKLIAEDNRRLGSAGDHLRFCDIAVLLADRANQPAYQAHFAQSLTSCILFPITSSTYPWLVSAVLSKRYYYFPRYPWVSSHVPSYSRFWFTPR